MEEEEPEFLCRAPRKHPDICGLFKHERAGERVRFSILKGSRLCSGRQLVGIRKDVAQKREEWVSKGLLVEQEHYALLTQDCYVAPSIAHSIVAGCDSIYKRKYFVPARRWGGRMMWKERKEYVELWAWMTSHELRRALGATFDIPPMSEIKGFFLGAETSYLVTGSAYDLVPILLALEQCVVILDVKVSVAMDGAGKTHLE